MAKSIWLIFILEIKQTECLIILSLDIIRKTSNIIAENKRQAFYFNDLLKDFEVYRFYDTSDSWVMAELDPKKVGKRLFVFDFFFNVITLALTSLERYSRYLI